MRHLSRHVDWIAVGFLLGPLAILSALEGAWALVGVFATMPWLAGLRGLRVRRFP